MNATKLVTLVALLLCVPAMALEKGDKKPGGPGMGGPMGEGPKHKPYDVILNNAKELELTPDQISKLTAMQKEEEAKMEQEREAVREKMKNDPEAREHFKAMMEARKNNDTAKMEELKKQMRDKIEKNNGGEKMKARGEDMKAKIAQVLTQEQMVKLKDVMDKHMENRALGVDEGQKGERKKPGEGDKAPKLFENDPAQQKQTSTDDRSKI